MAEPRPLLTLLVAHGRFHVPTDLMHLQTYKRVRDFQLLLGWKTAKSSVDTEECHKHKANQPTKQISLRDLKKYHIGKRAS